jgi:hypothetical protein
LPFRVAVEEGFRTLARLRRARAFHPRGRTFEATVERGAGRVAPGTAAIVRFSRTAGLPDPLPDASGIAVRLLDVGGAGHHQDLLLTTVWTGRPFLHHLLRLPRRPADALYSSVWPLEIDGAARLVTGRVRAPAPVADGLSGLLAAVAAGGVRIRLASAPLVHGADRPLLELLLGPEISREADEALRFHPANVGAGLRSVGALGLRNAAYAGSSRGRAEARRR